MSSSDPITFDVKADDDATEIFLIDGDFAMVSKGIGQATFTVPPGLYKIKTRSGRTAVEQFLAVDEGMDKSVTLDPVTFLTPIPLRNTIKTRDFHEEAAAAAAAQEVPDATAGNGSSILIVVRDWIDDAEPAPKTPPHNPAVGLKLRSLDGKLVADVEALARVQWRANRNPIATLKADVAPGAYRLHLQGADGRHVEQILIAIAGWQTQVFALLDGKGRADLINGSVTMGHGFDPADCDRRLEEIAREAFRADYHILSDALRERISDPDAPPMLALLGAMLLIRESKSDKEEKESTGDTTPHIDNTAAVAAIVQNLRAVFGPGSHPDVEAIAIGAGVADESYHFDAPPMYRASWRLLIKASADDPAVVPDSSFAAKVSLRMWGDGPWLLFYDPDSHDLTDTEAVWRANALAVLQNVAAARQQVHQTVARKLEGLLKRPFPNLLALHHAMPSAMEERLPEPAAPIDVKAMMADPEKRKQLVKRLGIPMAMVESWLNRLADEQR
jgi:hypothetical protein